MVDESIESGEYILSICIPTYNRYGLLSSLLASLVSQITKLQYRIQICISDNCSTDSTKQLIDAYAENYPFIVANSNRLNFGYDYNVCKVLDMAEGVYVWTFSDDDVILNHGIREIVSLLLKYRADDLSLIFARPQFIDKDEIELAQGIVTDSSSKNTIFSNNDDFLIEVNWLVSFVSSFIFKKDYVLSDIRDFIGTGFVHTAIIMGAVTKGKISISTGNTIVTSRQNNSGGYNVYRYFGTNICRIFNYFNENGYKESTIKKLKTDWLRFCVRGNVVNCRRQNADAKNSNLDLIIPYRGNVYFITRILPILVMPKRVFRVTDAIRNKFRQNAKS